MLRESEFYCPECDDGRDVSRAQNRRQFLGMVGAGAAAVAASSSIPSFVSADAPANRRAATPAEELVRELYGTMSAEQRRNLVMPWNHGPANLPSRLGTYNSAFQNKRIANNYTAAQKDLLNRIFRAVLANDEAYDRISRRNRWDSSGSFEGNGAVIFGTPSDDYRFTWLFSGHHLTIRCDGNSEPGAAFGGPLYYGHSTQGYSQRNVYYYQTEAVQAVFDSLNAEQRRQAVADRNPGDGRRGITFPREANHQKPGIAYASLTREQKGLVEGVMRALLSPFRSQDADEVMQILRTNGGLEQINLAYYREGNENDRQRWAFWRLEGPGFIWNYRPLPHVHCFVNIRNQQEA
jgi:hypothetical protein